MQRVCIIGPSGAGKSTFSLALAKATGLPLHHMDRLHWKPGWVATSREELIERLTPILAQERWIIDGNYSGTMPLRLAHADTVIFLDYPRRIYLWRVIKRVVTGFGRSRVDMTEGCPERLNWEFLKYVWEFERHTRPRVLAKLEALTDEQTLYQFGHPRETKAFLARLKSGAAA